MAKENIRKELTQTHQKELETRDYLIQLLKERVAKLQKAGSRQEGVAGTDIPTPFEDKSPRRPHSHTETGVLHASESLCVEVPTPTGAPLPTATSRATRLATLSQFSGDDSEDPGGFVRWLRKLERMGELHSWSDRELIQFELLLSGRAERIYELLPGSVKGTFQEATTALQKRLEPVGRDALRSAQLIRRRQKFGETVDVYAQDFERLFEQSYGCRTGMDEDSRNMLKRDLFVQGLLLKWQEKVLPSAETYMDALHQARANEKQSRQLANLHGAGGTRSQRKETGKETEKEPDGNATKALPKEKETSQGRL